MYIPKAKLFCSVWRVHGQWLFLNDDVALSKTQSKHCAACGVLTVRHHSRLELGVLAAFGLLLGLLQLKLGLGHLLLPGVDLGENNNGSSHLQTNHSTHTHGRGKDICPVRPCVYKLWWISTELSFAHPTLPVDRSDTLALFIV